MAGTNPRAARVAALIQRVIASSMEAQLHDKRLASVTITDVRVTNDLQIAKVYWTQLGHDGREQGERKRAKQALDQAKGRLRSLVGSKAGLRLTPQLQFIYDEVPSEAHEIEDILAVAHKRDEEIAKAHKDGDLHLHDLSMLTGYCAGWSLKQLIQQGLGIPGKINSTPASHLSTLCNQMVNFLGIMQNEWAGAQAFSSFDTYLAPFVKVDNLSYPEVKKCIESFIYGVNTPSRWGTQAPFSNITLDWTVPDDLANNAVESFDEITAE